MLAYTVAQRTREIGLRMALGADAGRVRRMMLRQVGWMTLVGASVGLLAAIGLGMAAGSLLYDLKGYDPLVLTPSTALLVLVAFTRGAGRGRPSSPRGAPRGGAPRPRGSGTAEAPLAGGRRPP